MEAFLYRCIAEMGWSNLVVAIRGIYGMIYPSFGWTISEFLRTDLKMRRA